MGSAQLDVCMYTPNAHGGHARYTHELLSAISEVGRDKGVRVSLVTSSDLDSKYRTSFYPIHDVLPPLLHRSAFRGILHWGFSRTIHYSRRERTFLRWIRGTESCEIVHFQDYTTWLAARHFRLLRALGKRLLLTVHNIYPHTYPPGMLKLFYPLQVYWRRTAFRMCHALFVHSEDLRRQLAEFLGVGHPPIFVTPHGVWNSTVGTVTATDAKERVQRRRLLFFGVIRRNKGLHTLLHAMKGLTDCTLTVAGTPEEPRYQEQVRALIERLPPGRVELIDRFIEDDEMTRLFERSSLVILPYSSFTSQSGVLHDALAYGLPLVATDVGALGESVRRWGIGQVVPPNDDAALTGAIREMLMPDRYAEASRAVDRAREHLSWRRTAEVTIEAYRLVARGGSKATAS